jgi:hypothetical protein
MAQRARTKAQDQLAWLEERSPLHQEMDWLWAQNERRYEGGHRVRNELWRFDWETVDHPPADLEGDVFNLSSRARLRDGTTIKRDDWLNWDVLMPGEHYRRRKDSATYVNFMEDFANDLVGHIMREAPAPDAGLDFGTLGKVRRKEDIDIPTQAELVYYNVDGVGIDGSQWDSFWSAQMKLAMATGFRWIYIDAPPEPPRTQARERKGFRPYVVAFSPRQVTNHLYRNGVLQWAVVQIASRNPKVNDDGTLEGNDGEREFLLLVRKGVTSLGAAFKNGGWWRYDEDKNEIGHGTWDKTDGDIPMTPLIYDRHPEMLGRPGLTELGNAAVAAMNIHSAADFDAFDASGSVKALFGVDVAGYNLFIEKVREGNRYAPVPMNQEFQPPKTPSMGDASQGQVVADVFDKRLKNLAEAVDRIKGNEVSSAPQASGLAQQAGFTLGNVPRLSIVAGNLEGAQNFTITMFELRFGNDNPSGSARWTRKFKLIQLTSSAQSVLQLEVIAGIASEELDATVITAAAQDEGFVPDNQTKTKIEAELREAFKRKRANEDKALVAKTTPSPGAPGERSRAAPPEPAQTNQPIKDQLDGPNVA